MSLKEVISSSNPPLVVAFGNPLLDYFITGEDESILAKRSLLADESTEVSQKDIVDLLTDLPNA